MGSTEKFDYDYIVIGGGSGGLASGKQAAGLGARVLVLDFVKPSIRGLSWGLGGTCVNVGCIPKKLLHFAAQTRQFGVWEAPMLGCNPYVALNPFSGFPENQLKPCDWQTLVERVQSYIKQLNFSYRVGLQNAGCTYTRALARLVGPHTVEYEEKGVKKEVSAKHLLLAVGGRPHVPPEVPGAREFCVTSDEIFSLKQSPGKTSASPFSAQLSL
ncbi:Thioredoxin reductase 1, related [Eimeria tenella]|uniref:Thioredoxin reductase 1, related n=1 Tax=Eimeria tenella TaxID=5802 RepID=U6KVT9_EIMTE|nr:Thioredoxin reductase 1, related [Eimeria tenella]CDJ41038.1 Thioredoxin reductase 1, related [Eimeria tenella]|eukprot:XP_013231788.1 Thioredoxin reductase 1, related [Eimeria tenella]